MTKISRKVASDDAQWGAWLGKRLDQLGQAGAAAADRAFGVVEAVGKGVGDGVGAIGQGIGRAVMLGVGVLSLGAVVVGGVYLLRGKE